MSRVAMVHCVGGGGGVLLECLPTHQSESAPTIGHLLSAFLASYLTFDTLTFKVETRCAMRRRLSSK